MLSVALLCLAASAAGCGSGDGASRSASREVKEPKVDEAKTVDGYLRGDEDGTFDDQPGIDDDKRIRYFGHAASKTQKQAVTATVKRYLAVSAAGDSRTTCTMLVAGLARSADLERDVPEAYRPAPGSPLLRVKGCAGVLGVLLAADRGLLQAESSTGRVVAVRVSGNVALAILAFPGYGERTIALEREPGAWRIDALLDRAFP